MCPESCYVDKVGLDLTGILLPLSQPLLPKCWLIKGPAQNGSFNGRKVPTIVPGENWVSTNPHSCGENHLLLQKLHF